MTEEQPALIESHGEVVPFDARFWFPGIFYAVTSNTFPCFPLRLNAMGEERIGAGLDSTAGFYESEVEHLAYTCLDDRRIDRQLFWIARWI